MAKRKALIDSDSSSDCSDLDAQFLNLAKKKKKPGEVSPKGRKQQKQRSDSESQDSSEDDDEDRDSADSRTSQGSPDAGKNKTGKIPRKKSTDSTGSGGKGGKSNKDKDVNSEPEEGEVSSNSDSEEETKKPTAAAKDSDSSGFDTDDSEFNDGYDENLMGDSEDRARLAGLSEKEREQEIFKRIERRELMKTRWEIERKLRLARRKKGESRPAPRSKSRRAPSPASRAASPAHTAAAPASPHRATSAPGTGGGGSAAAASPPASSMPPPASRDKDRDRDESMHSDDDNNSEDKQDKDKSSADQKAGYLSNVQRDLDDAIGELDEKERPKERRRAGVDDKRVNAMAALKAKREGKQRREQDNQRKEEERQRAQDEGDDLIGGSKSSVKLKASDIYSDDSGSDSDDNKSQGRQRSSDSSRSSSDSESDKKSVSSNRARAAGSTRKPTNITTKEELNKIRISRHKIERFLNLPIFSKVANGCFVRISIGNNNDKAVYRVAEIVEVCETAKVYLVGKTRTNKGLKLRHGAQDRVFRLEFISNSEFSDTEFNKWRDTCVQADRPLPSLEHVETKIRDITEAMLYQFKEEDVDKIIQEKDRFRAHPTNYAMKKTQLMKDRDAAVLRGDEDIGNDLTQKIQELEERANHLDKVRTSTIQSISYINNRNRKLNVEGAEKAIMEEIRANKGKKVDDPFTRRSTKPVMNFKSFAAQERSQEEEAETVLEVAKEAEQLQQRQDSWKDKQRSHENNLYSLHDFEINIDLEVPQPINAVSVLPKPLLNKAKDTGPKRALNLEDYKKKRGLI